MTACVYSLLRLMVEETGEAATDSAADVVVALRSESGLRSLFLRLLPLITSPSSSGSGTQQSITRSTTLYTGKGSRELPGSGNDGGGESAAAAVALLVDLLVLLPKQSMSLPRCCCCCCCADFRRRLPSHGRNGKKRREKEELEFSRPSD